MTAEPDPDSRRLVAFALAGQRWALALAAVERVLPMVAVSPLATAPEVVLGVVNVHGRVVPVFDVRRRLGLPARPWTPAGHLLLARAGRRAVALPVDEALGVVTAAPAAIAAGPPDLPPAPQVAGVAVLPDGLLFIHDLDRFLSLEEERQLAGAMGEAAR